MRYSRETDGYVKSQGAEDKQRKSLIGLPIPNQTKVWSGILGTSFFVLVILPNLLYIIPIIYAVVVLKWLIMIISTLVSGVFRRRS